MRWIILAGVCAVLSAPGARATEPAIPVDGALDTDAAIAAYSRALARTPGPPDMRARLFQSRCQIQVRAGAFTEALEDCDQAIALAPDLAVAFASRGEAAIGLGRLDQAAADLAAAIDLDPDLIPLQATRARLLARLAAWEDAIAAATEALAQTPDATDLYGIRAAAWMELGDPAAALIDYGSFLRHGGDPQVGHLGRARAHLMLDRRDGARTDAQAVLSFDPNAIDALIIVAEVDRRDGRLTDAIDALDQARALAPARLDLVRQAAGLYLAAGRSAPARALLDLLIGGGGDGADVRRARAGLLLADADWQAAAADLSHLIDIGAATHADRVQLALAQARQGFGGVAISTLSAALARRPDATDALVLRASLLRARGQVEQASADLTTALAIDPDLVDARAQRGLIRLDLGAAAAALADFDAALATDPDRADAARGRAAALVALGRYGEAAGAYDALIETLPDAPADTAALVALRHDRGVVRRLAGDFTGAMADFDDVIAEDPDMASARINRARAQLGLGDIPAARQDLDVALALAPDDPEALALRGMVLRITGDVGAGLADLNRAVDGDPDSVFAREQRALAQASLGDLDAAIDDLRAASPDGDALRQRQRAWIDDGLLTPPATGDWSPETDTAARRWLLQAIGAPPEG